MGPADYVYARSFSLFLVACIGAAAALDAPTPVSLVNAFVVTSDWGGTNSAPYTTLGQTAAAAAMNTIINTEACSFVLSAGNNFMPSGLPSGENEPQTETRFSSTWQDVYTADVPWYVTGGYMDWMGNATAERALTGSDGGRWNYPDLWHTFTVPLSEAGENLQIIMVDTVTLSGAMLNNPGIQNIPEGAIPGDSTLAMETGGGTFSKPQAAATAPVMFAAGATTATPSVATAAAATLRRGLRWAGVGAKRRLHDFNVQGNPPISTVQWTWLETTLAQSTANWIIVVGNDPIWSVGAHGPTWALVDQMLPLLNKAAVALYLSGRDPVAQHIAPSITYPNVDFVGTGNGAYSNASQAQYVPTLNLNPSSSLRFVSGKDTGFVTVTHEGDASNSTSRLVVTYYDSTGTALYFFSKANPRNVPIVPLDEQKLTGVQTTLEIGDGDGPTVSPLVAVLCMLVIFGVLGVAFIINRTEGDETTEIAKTAAKEKDNVTWGPTARQAALGAARTAASAAATGTEVGRGAGGGGGATVVRGGTANTAAERRPLLPKHRLNIDTDL